MRLSWSRQSVHLIGRGPLCRDGVVTAAALACRCFRAPSAIPRAVGASPLPPWSGRRTQRPLLASYLASPSRPVRCRGSSVAWLGGSVIVGSVVILLLFCGAWMQARSRSGYCRLLGRVSASVVVDGCDSARRGCRLRAMAAWYALGASRRCTGIIRPISLALICCHGVRTPYHLPRPSASLAVSCA